MRGQELEQISQEWNLLRKKAIAIIREASKRIPESFAQELRNILKPYENLHLSDAVQDHHLEILLKELQRRLESFFSIKFENQGFFWFQGENYKRLQQVLKKKEEVMDSFNKLSELLTHRLSPELQEIWRHFKKLLSDYVSVLEKVKRERPKEKYVASQLNNLREEASTAFYRFIESLALLRNSAEKAVRPTFVRPTVVEALQRRDKRRVLMLTHEYGGGGVGGVKTVVRELVQHLTNRFFIEVIERSIQPSDAGTFYFFPHGSRQYQLAFSDMSIFLTEVVPFSLSLFHVQSINFAAGPQGWSNGGLDELKSVYREAPVLYTVHSVVKHERTRRTEEWLEYSIQCQEETIKRANHFIVLHQFGKQVLQQYYGIPDNRITIIPNGLRVESLFLQRLKELAHKEMLVLRPNPVLLYVGRLSPEKGLLELVEAVRTLRSHFPRIELLIVGPTEGIIYEQLKVFIREYNLGKNVHFLGSIPPEEQTVKVYERFKPELAVLPSIHESFPLFALEAIAHGVPLLITDCDGPRTIFRPLRLKRSPDGLRGRQVDDQGEPLQGIEQPLAVAVDGGDSSSIVDAVTWAVKHPRTLHAILHAAMREVKEKYSWEQVARITGDLYDSLVEGKPFSEPFLPIMVKEKVVERSLRVGIAGHFRLKSNVVPDGVARWVETIFGFLRQQGWDVKGFAFAGAARDEDGKVFFRKMTQLDELVDLMAREQRDIVIVRGDAESARIILDGCRERGIKTLFVMPFFGVWEGAYRLAKKATLVVTPIKRYSAKIAVKTGHPCRFVPWPINTQFWKRVESDFVWQLAPKSWPRDASILVYVGRVAKEKRIHRLIKPFAEYLKQTSFSVRLLICGSGDDEESERLQKVIEESGVRDFVHHEKRSFTSQEVRAIYSSCSVFIFPSCFETYGQSNLEAISCGTPTLVPVGRGFEDLAVPSMANLEGYDFGFSAGKLYDPHGNFNPQDHDWDACFQQLERILSDYKGALRIMEKWSRRIKDEMSTEVIGRKIEMLISEFGMKEGL